MTIFVTMFVPDYAEGDEDYCPWVVGHEDVKQVEPGVIQSHWDSFLAEGDLDRLEIFQDFYDYLEETGYETYIMAYPPITLEVPKE